MNDPLDPYCPECGANIHLVAHAPGCSRRRSVAEPSNTYGPADAARDGFCPYCEAAHPRRVWESVDRAPDGSVSIAAYCARCGAEWGEVYRLERVEILKPGRKKGP